MIYKIRNTNLNVQGIIVFYARLFTNQSSDIIEKVSTKYKHLSKINKILIIKIIFIWQIGALLITKMFTGSFLNTFFITHTVPLVDSLQDIIENKQLIVLSDPEKY